jgi:hypothetical protein
MVIMAPILPHHQVMLDLLNWVVRIRTGLLNVLTASIGKMYWLYIGLAIWLKSGI